MTDAPAAPDSREFNFYLQAWADALAQALEAIGGVSFSCTVAPDTPLDLQEPQPDDLWIVAAARGGLRGEMSLRLPPAATVRLAQMLMSEPVTPTEVNAHHRETALELMRQVAGLAATQLKATWGELQLHLDASPVAPSWPASSSAWFRVGDETPAIWIQAHLSAALAASLRSEKAGAEEATCVVDQNAGQAPAASTCRDAKVNFDLLMDVELDVTLRFGSRRLLLRELLDLSPGSVITLDRRVQEPVDMLLDGRVVARGEVVVTNGNYALRVSEIGPAGV